MPKLAHETGVDEKARTFNEWSHIVACAMRRYDNQRAQPDEPEHRSTFSKTFSKLVSNGSSEQCMSYLKLLENLLVYASKTGHEPPDSDLRLQF